jgi:hypothetical protein
MAEINCPICNRINDENAERCWYCQAVLHPDQAEPGQGGDWLDGFRSDSNGTSPGDQSASSTGGEKAEEVPDWLARIRRREQIEREESAASDQGSGQDAVDWLRDIADDMSKESDSSAEPAAGVPEPVSAENDDSAEWMKKLETWQTENKAKGPTSEFTRDQKRVAQEKEAEYQIPEKEESPRHVIPNDQPDWLKELTGEGESGKEETTTPDLPVEPEPFKVESIENLPVENIEQDTGKVESEGEEVTAANENEPEAVQEIPAAEVVPEQPAAIEPDWLSGFQPLSPDKDLSSQVLPPQAKEQVEKPAFSDRDLMSWINKDQQSSTESEHKEVVQPEPAPQEITSPEKTAETGAEAEGELVRAAIPSWLQNLRPDKSGQSSPTGKRPTSGESKGPLAGIDGALKGQPLHEAVTRPQAYNNTLKISPEQENLIQRMQSIAGDVRWEAKETGKPASRGSNVLRIVVTLLLIGAVVAAMFVNQTSLAAPSLYPQPVVRTHDTVSALDPTKPVLIAADFDSSLFGELKWSSEALLGKLLALNIPVAYLSTTPVGTTLLQGELNGLAQKYPDYMLADRTVNLGYLAGGTVGLQSLAQDPQSTLPLDVDFKPSWEKTPFDAVQKISDFGAVIVITENADTAKYWIEQVDPALGTTPMIVIISAQSAPMLQPYYDSGQVDGYLSGLSDAVAFERIEGETNIASMNYAAYQISLLAVALAIFIGGLICLIVRTPSSERSAKERQ